jgi:predicted Rossmann-fold nucleotide-binding protein
MLRTFAMTRQIRRVAIYCGSASPENPRYEELAMEIGEALALRGIGVVYGGGKLGLMGAVAAGALLAAAR